MNTQFVLLVVSYALLAHGTSIPCTYTSSDNSFYDLTPLSRTDNVSPYKFSSKNGQLLYNICGNLIQNNPCGLNSSVCFIPAGAGVPISEGSINSVEWSDDADDAQAGVQLTYGNGDVCEFNENAAPTPRKTVIQLKCQSDVESNIVSVDQDSQPCKTIIEVQTRYACPSAIVGTGEAGGFEDSWRSNEAARGDFFISLIVTAVATMLCICVCACIRRRRCRSHCKRTQQQNLHSQTEMTVISQPLLSPPTSGVPSVSYAPAPYMPYMQPTQYYYYPAPATNAVSDSGLLYPAPVPVPTSSADVSGDEQITADEKLARELQAKFNAEV